MTEEEIDELISIKLSDDGAEEILKLTGNIPFSLQWLGLNSYFQARHLGTKTVSKEIVGRAYKHGIKSIPQFERDFERLTKRQKNVLVAIAMGKNTPSQIARGISIREPNTVKELNALVGVGYVEKVGRGKYCMVDRVFEEWLKRKV